jgi:UDP-N-acetylmuramyl pentapeptide phosphotransferase/UDP-N-acetylglucosamine-1-phosphate transferase
MTGQASIALEALLLSGGLVGTSVWYARRAGHLDVPNDRSSHSVPTPRGAGLGFVTTLLILGTAITLRASPGFSRELAFVGIALAVLAIVGWLDDRYSLSALTRFGIQVAVSVTLAVLVNRVAPLSGVANAAWLFLWTFWAASSINIVNFMDGIDGMIGAQAVVYGLYLYAILPHDSLGALFGLTLAFASLGFLIWNWPPARIFMGDVGSGPLGLVLVLGGVLAVGVGTHPALVFLPLFPLFFDSLATIVLRVRRGEHLTVAHRSHLYQRAAKAAGGHAVVTASFAAAATVGALVGIAVHTAPASTLVVGIVGYAGFIVLLWVYFHRRFPVVARSA